MVLASLFDCRGPAGEGLGRPVGNGEGGTELAHCSAFQTDGIDRTQGLAYSLERLQHVAFPDSKKRDVELLGRILGRETLAGTARARVPTSSGVTTVTRVPTDREDRAFFKK
jgi:hypothetical protein